MSTLKKPPKTTTYITDVDLMNVSENESGNFKNLLNLIRMNYVRILVIAFSIMAMFIIYAVSIPDIYRATTMLKISKPKGDILEAPFLPELTESKSTFVKNEIEILNSYTIREKVARAVMDSFKINGGDYRIIFDKEILKPNKKKFLPLNKLIRLFETKVEIEQKKDLEIVNISVESPSAYEAMMITNIYAKVYYELNLNFNRLQMIEVCKFLEKQNEDKHSKLLQAENSLKQYQEKGGIIELDEQAKALIAQLTDFESRRDASKIELTMAERTYSEYKKELSKQEPRLTEYLEKYSIEPYLQGLQMEIAKYEVKKDIALNNIENKEIDEQVKVYDLKIADLKAKRDNKLQVYKTGIMAASSDDLKMLLQKVIEAGVKYNAIVASYNELNKIVTDYENKFSDLPKRTIDFARLVREKGETEKLYLLIQEKYQEALINEQSTPGNVLIIDPAIIPFEPFKPNRIIIILMGLFIGLVVGTCYEIFKNYLDNTISSPEDIEKLNINILGWIPRINDKGKNGTIRESEFIIAKMPDSIASEAYRALRTRIQFSKVGKDAIKTLLITSSSPKEGKTLSSVNIAGSFAQAGKKTIIVDCDLRKPRIAKVFKQDKSPGLTDYLFENINYEGIIRETELHNLYYIPSGTIPPNPSEILASTEMKIFLERLRNEFDLVIIDSPPILAVTDAEILTRMVDATILVTSAGSTEIEVMKKSVELMENYESSFIGVLLNNFTYREGYGNYYKYYYYYNSSDKEKRRAKHIENYP